MAEDNSSHVLDSAIKYKASDDVDQIHGNNLDIPANHLYLMGEATYADNDVGQAEPGVEFLMANRFIKNMNILMRRNPDRPILIHMKTCGGMWEEGMAIYDMIKACPTPVTILNYTHARSMSSIIFQAANKRVMMPNSSFMFHDGTLGVDGTVKQVESAVAFNAKATDVMLDIYVNSMKRKGKFARKSKEFIREWLRAQMDKKEDVYLTAEEAVAYGLADEIFGKEGQYNWGHLTEYSEEELAR